MPRPEIPSRTFGRACRLLPREVRDDVRDLYLAFRTLDDLVDEGDPGAEAALDEVERWADGGPPPSGAAAVFARLDAPRGAVRDFCAGMRDDLAGRRSRTEADVDRYCYRVAGTVGLVMAHVLGASPGAERAAITLGTAMQRTNILRDIDEDLAAGRVYLARETIDRHGGSLAPGRRTALMRDQIARADALYETGLAGIAQLHRGRAGVRAAACMYREILRQIERDGYAAGRAVISPSRSALAISRALLTVRLRPPRLAA